jgi:hypothetical protein
MHKYGSCDFIGIVESGGLRPKAMTYRLHNVEPIVVKYLRAAH